MPRTAAVMGVLAPLLVLVSSSTSRAVNQGIFVKKLVVVDKLAFGGTAKVAFRGFPGLKGSGVDPDQISARFDVAYENESAIGAFTIPAGVANGWQARTERVVKYTNPEAPLGPTEVKAVVVKQRGAVKLLAKGLGTPALDIVSGGGPPGQVLASLCVDNAGEEVCNCSVMDECVWKSIAAGSGAKLVCKDGREDYACQARCLATREPGRFVDQGSTVLDTCTMLEWEKKDTAVGSGADAGNLHDVDNLYSWAGRCTGPNADPLDNAFCQPSAASAAACLAQTGGALGCDECGPGEGTCDVAVNPLGGGPSAAITTIWEWITQLNASGFAGHTDWRLPTSQGFLPDKETGDAAELESILDLPPFHDQFSTYCNGACIDPVFGPTKIFESDPIGALYWSISTWSGDGTEAAGVSYSGKGPRTWLWDKVSNEPVRAVRASS